MALGRQPKTAGFRLKSRYKYIVHWLSKYEGGLQLSAKSSKWSAMLKRLRTTALDRSILLKILLETRLEFKCFEPLIGFLTFLDQTFWPKSNKLIIQSED